MTKCPTCEKEPQNHSKTRYIVNYGPTTETFFRAQRVYAECPPWFCPTCGNRFLGVMPHFASGPDKDIDNPDHWSKGSEIPSWAVFSNPR